MTARGARRPLRVAGPAVPAARWLPALTVA